MARPRMALLNASFSEESTRRNFRRELDADLVEFDVHEDLPPSFEYDGIVITGSGASVYWDEAWIEDLIEWVREATDRGLPALGVCYGHQVLAEARGGEVEPMGEYEIGYRGIDRVGDSPLLEGVGRRFTAFTTHQDTVAELPPEATLLAENEYGVQGFRDGHVFAVQFHPEYDMETAAEVTRGKDLDGARIEAVLDGITEENYAAACEAKRLFDNFVAYVEGVRAGTAAD